DPRNAQIVMNSLRDINRDHGITVITNLHTLDTARAYSTRIIGMAAGRVVFDGKPSQLTEAAARTIYGADGMEEAFSEAITPTACATTPALPITSRPISASKRSRCFRPPIMMA